MQAEVICTTLSRLFDSVRPSGPPASADEEVRNALLLLPQTSPAARPQAPAAPAIAALPHLPRLHLRGGSQNTPAPSLRLTRFPPDEHVNDEGPFLNTHGRD